MTSAHVRRKSMLVRFSCVDRAGSQFEVLSRVPDGAGMQSLRGLLIMATTSSSAGKWRVAPAFVFRSCDLEPFEPGWLRCRSCDERVTGGITAEGIRHVIATNRGGQGVSVFAVGIGVIRMKKVFTNELLIALEAGRRTGVQLGS